MRKNYYVNILHYNVLWLQHVVICFCLPQQKYTAKLAFFLEIILLKVISRKEIVINNVSEYKLVGIISNKAECCYFCFIHGSFHKSRLVSVVVIINIYSRSSVVCFSYPMSFCNLPHCHLFVCCSEFERQDVIEYNAIQCLVL